MLLYRTIGIANQILLMASPLRWNFCNKRITYKCVVQTFRGRYVCMEEIEIELTTLSSLLWTARQGVASPLVTGDMILVCGSNDVIIRVSQDTIRQWLAMDIFRMLHRMRWRPFLALLAIARFAEVDTDITDTERFSYCYKRSKLVCMAPIRALTRKWADGTETIQGGHYEIRPVHR